MTSTEAPFSLNTRVGPNDKIQVTLRGNSYDDLVNNAQNAGISRETVAALFAQAFAANQPHLAIVQQAEDNVRQIMPGSTTIGQPLAQPGQPTPITQAQSTGPSCAHGPRVYRDTPSSRGPWKRWECAQPWVKGGDNSQRCQAVNV